MALRRIIASLPWLCDPAEIHTESVSLADEAKADAISAVIDQRDVPNWDIPLHLAVKFGDDTVTEMLMLAGADWSLQNEQSSFGLLCMVLHKDKEVMKALDGAGAPVIEANVQQEVRNLVIY
ncbi:unnamed protein product [Fraxinus pennsylvanica]|uniref:Uncharacterized protein n=1 Tax=Fraxinus pennsylvanica TaxID=56036 RepID=A0AAD2DLQ9_9LAMI|nr:unnamed protein product [Fraxinus pennsylvanica]